jgi:hypothetical protein
MSSKWNFNQVNGWKGLQPSNRENQLIAQLPNNYNISNPPGWDNTMLQKSKVDEIVGIQNSASGQSASAQNINAVKEKIAWNVALGPVKSLPMKAFMMYMVGSQISIFPIMMMCMNSFQTIQGLLQFKNATKAFDGNEQKILLTMFWIFGQMLCCGMVIWQCNRMGILPTHPSDWLTFSSPAVSLETSSKNYL